MALNKFEVHYRTNVLKTDKYIVSAKSSKEALNIIKCNMKYIKPDDTTYEPLGADYTYAIRNLEDGILTIPVDIPSDIYK